MTENSQLGKNDIEKILGCENGGKMKIIIIAFAVTIMLMDILLILAKGKLK